jgi:hypothetical protein
MLVVEGTFGTLDLSRRLAFRGRLAAARRLAIGTAAVLLAAAALARFPDDMGTTALPLLVVLIPAVGAVALAGAAAWPERRVAAFAAPVLGLALTGIAAWRATSGLQLRASFQRPEMHRARATFARAVEPGAVVITTEDIGRPAENIDYYSGVARALYLTDLRRWHITLPQAINLFLYAKMTPYLLLPKDQPGRGELLAPVKRWFEIEVVADIPAEQAMDYFVAAAFHRGLPLELLRVARRRPG